MAQKHNQWMRILSAVFSALANLFGSLKIKNSPGADLPENSDTEQ